MQALRKKGLKMMNPALLRQILASEAFASQTFSKIKQSVWDGLIDKMIGDALVKGKIPGILKLWKETRHKEKFEMPDFDLADLDSLIDDNSVNNLDNNADNTSVALNA